MIRLLGALLFAAAAIAVAVGVVWMERDVTLRVLRETAPLAGLIGGVLGYSVFGRWPRSATQALILSLMSAAVAIVFFVALYVFGESVIAAFKGAAPGDAVQDAVARLASDLPLGAALALGGFSVAGMLMWTFGVIGRAFRR